MKRINNLLKDIERNGYNGIGKPEPLKYDLQGFRSARIDDYNRIVFRIVDGNMAVRVPLLIEQISNL